MNHHCSSRPADVLIGYLYLAAAAVSVGSILIGRPWVGHLAKRTAPEQIRSMSAYSEMTNGLTAIWAALFAVAALIAFTVDGWIPIAIGVVLFLLGRLSPTAGRWYVRQRLGTSATN